jgi:hypothetical protein
MGSKLTGSSMGKFCKKLLIKLAFYSAVCLVSIGAQALIHVNSKLIGAVVDTGYFVEFKPQGNLNNANSHELTIANSN